MADTFIQVPTDGSGKKLDTRTEGTNSEHRQVMVIGDPATNAGVAPVDATKGLAVDLTNSGTNSNAFAVTAASLPLPSGAATSANQTTGNSSLSTIAGAISSSKMATKAASGDFADGAIATIGTKTDAKSSATDTTSVSIISLLKQLSDYLSTLVGGVFDVVTPGDTPTNLLGISGHPSALAVKTDGSGVTQPVSNSTLTNAGAGNYETIAASQTDQAMGATGASGDYFSHLTIIPGSTSPGAVSIKDGSGSSISVFAGGSSSVVSLAPFTVYLGAISGSGAWKVTTGANVTAIGFGKFT